jgi:hypothetical protein
VKEEYKRQILGHIESVKLEHLWFVEPLPDGDHQTNESVQGMHYKE